MLVGVALVASLVSGCTAGVGQVGPSPTDPSMGRQVAPSSTSGSRTVAQPPTQPPAPPAVDAGPKAARLEWLDGRPDRTGVRTKDPGGTRWQGPVAGEFALLRDDGFSWFGSDGAMVGCRNTKGCIGIDAAGYSAVVLTEGHPRLVYRPDGSFLGRFDADGLAVPGGVAPNLEAAITSTGVDAAELIDRGTRTTAFAGGVTGDPHFHTAGGVRYSNQRPGDFHARYGDPVRAVQLRVEPMPRQRGVSLVAIVAIGTAGSRIQYTADGELTVNGAAIKRTGEFVQKSVAGGPEIGWWPTGSGGKGTAVVVWPDGGSVVMGADAALGLTVVAHLPKNSGVGGLFGGSEVSGASDLRDPSGAVVDPDAAAADSSGLLQSWEVAEIDSLFDTLSPATGSPGAPLPIAEDSRVIAEKACAAAGLVDGRDRLACVFDVGLTGDDGFVAGHAAVAFPANRPVAPPGLATRWSALVPGTQTVPVPLDSTGDLDLELAPGSQAGVSVNVRTRGVVAVEQTVGCPPGTRTYPAAADPAIRMFDPAGHAVSARLPACGTVTSAAVLPGEYLVVFEAPEGGAAQQFRGRIVVP